MKRVVQSNCELWSLDDNNNLVITKDEKDYKDRLEYAKKLLDFKYIGEEELKGHIFRKETYNYLDMILSECFLIPYKNKVGIKTSESSFNKMYFYKPCKTDFEIDYKVKKVYTSQKYKSCLGLEYVEQKVPVSSSFMYKWPVKMSFNFGWCQGTFYFKTEEDRQECRKYLEKRRKDLKGVIDITGCEKIYGNIYLTPKLQYNPFIVYKKEQFYLQIHNDKVINVHYYIGEECISIVSDRMGGYIIDKIKRVDN